MLSCSLLKFLDVVAETQQTQPCVSRRRGPQSGLLVLKLPGFTEMLTLVGMSGYLS